MRLPIRAAPGCLVLLLAAGCASAGSSGSVRSYASTPDFQVRETWSDYPVRGTEAGELEASLLRNAPRKDGFAAFGLTRWSLAWEYDLRRSPGDCRIVAPRVNADLEIILPRWVSAVPVDPRLLSRWQSFRDALAAHEEGHRRLVLDAGREIAERLRLTSAATCGLARHRADREARSIVEEYDRRNRVYDMQTRGGRTQGVHWP